MDELMLTTSEEQGQVDERKKRFTEWIAAFIEYYETQVHQKIFCSDKADDALNKMYWTMLRSNVKPYTQVYVEGEGDIKKYVNRFKIISLTELTIIIAQPFGFCEPSDEAQISKLNAEFAWFVGSTILLGWLSTQNVSIDRLTVRLLTNYKSHRDIMTIKEEHIVWLSALNRQSTLPIFSNAQFWRMAEFGLLSLIGKIKAD